jgi:hypothetical protein
MAVRDGRSINNLPEIRRLHKPRHAIQVRVINMTPSSNFKLMLYYSFVTVACFVSFYCVFIDIQEIIRRSSGQYTIFSQTSWLTDKEAILYCSFLTVVFTLLLAVIGDRLYHKKIKSVILLCGLTLSLAIVKFFVETLFYYKPV